MKIVLVTGGFDPLHAGHIAYFKAARSLGDMLIVGLNSDEWLSRKKGRPFMKWEDRFAVTSNISGVDRLIEYDDSDDSSKNAIIAVRQEYPDATIVFANGGDRTKDNIPEMNLVDSNLEFVFGVGGEDKINSSSTILKQWKSQEVIRTWGSYNVLQEIVGAKVKTLMVAPGQSLSMQRHQFRNEYWMVTDGTCMINMALPGVLNNPPKILTKYDEFRVPVNTWHQLTNPFTKPCTIIEIQYGEQCVEDDIERLDASSQTTQVQISPTLS
jgi:cytidyltransferase-like protein